MTSRADTRSSLPTTAALTGVLLACSAADVSSPVVVDVAPQAGTPAHAATTARPTASMTARKEVAGVIPWMTDLASASAQSQRTGKPLFVYVRASWSAPALSMERTTLESPEVARAARPYIAVYVDLVDDDVVADAEVRLGTTLDKVPLVILIDPKSGAKVSLAGASDAESLVDELGGFVTDPQRGP